MVWGSRHTRSSLIGLRDVIVLGGQRWEPSSRSCRRHCGRLYIRGLKFEYTVKVLFKRSVQEGKEERLRVGIRSKAWSKNRRRGKGRQGTDGTAASMYVLCHHIYTCPNLPDGQCFNEGIARKSKDYIRQSPSESAGDSQMTWRTSRMMRTKLRDVGGGQK